MATEPRDFDHRCISPVHSLHQTRRELRPYLPHVTDHCTGWTAGEISQLEVSIQHSSRMSHLRGKTELASSLDHSKALWLVQLYSIREELHGFTQGDGPCIKEG